MTRWDSAAAPLFAVTAREGVWDYVTRAPPLACCTHPALCKHSLTRYHQTPIKDTLTLTDACAHSQTRTFSNSVKMGNRW